MDTGGPILVGPKPCTVRLSRVLPHNRPGWRPALPSMPGCKNNELLMIEKVNCLVKTPAFFNVYIDNPYAVPGTGKESEADGFVCSWVWSPGLGGGIQTQRIAIGEFLRRRNMTNSAETLCVTIVPYCNNGHEKKFPGPGPVATIAKICLEYE